jgi:hypothetical protein
MMSCFADIVIPRGTSRDRPRVLLLLVAVWAANVAIAGNLDVEIYCVPERIDQTVKKASDGGANETKEHWIYDVTVESQTFKELANLDLRYVIFLKQEQLGVRGAPTPHQQSGSFSIACLCRSARSLVGSRSFC